MPQSPGESNFFIDLWNPGELATFARAAGLTNNHALFIDSHGKASTVPEHEGYCFYPNAKLLSPASSVPFFSVADLASLLEPEQRNSIHNVVLTGCNQEGTLQSQLVRRYFANATNIVYMEPGKPAYKPMLYQVLTSHSTEIRPLYGRLHSLPQGVLQCKVSLTPEPGTGELGRYVADLFLPGARHPYRHQTAGRELLESQERNRSLDSTSGRSK